MEQDSTIIDFREVLWKARRYKWLALFPVVLIVCAAWIYLMITPPVYESTVVVFGPRGLLDVDAIAELRKFQQPAPAAPTAAAGIVIDLQDGPRLSVGVCNGRSDLRRARNLRGWQVPGHAEPVLLQYEAGPQSPSK